MFNFFKRFYTFRNSIHFVYSEPQRYYGSTVMRGEQLSKIAQKYIGKKVYFTSTLYKYRNCILYLTKWAIYSLKEGDLQKLKSQQNILIFDVIDGDLPKNKIEYADAIVAASKTIYDNYKSVLPKSKKVFLIDHHPDPRIKSVDWSRRPTKLRAAYFGELINTVITLKICKEVDIFPVSTIYQNNDWFKELPKYNLHYAIRQKRKVYPNKPFVKGFTAALCNSNILIQDSEKEAVRWLGKDYPYLLKGKVTQKKILDMLSYIEKSYGSNEWKRGLKIMGKIKKRISEKTIGGQLVKLLKYCSEVKR